jgi:arsenate reductase
MKDSILFLCPHGGAKSVIAAAYFEKTARLPFVAVAAAAEEPYEEVPAPVAAFLGIHGLVPRRVEPADFERAARVIAIDCEVDGAERSDDVPKVSEDFEGSVAAIRRHVDALIEELGNA